MLYELKLETYQGPLDKLLELVEGKKLEITKISLAEVTADFLEFLKKLEVSGVNHSVIADFLVVASKLILIKSKVLLPSLTLSGEEESEIHDLETRLKIYAELKEAKEILIKNWNEFPEMQSREFLMNWGPVFYPPQKIGAKDLYGVLSKLIEEFEVILRPVETIKTEIISLKSKIEHILKKITETPLQFKNFAQSGSKKELVVLFLAILHLIKDQLIEVGQDSHFEEMTITKKIN